jgi:hypothetical protein
VERILEAREWDAYGQMMDVLRGCLAQVRLPIHSEHALYSLTLYCSGLHNMCNMLLIQADVEQPGSEAYNVLINMHQTYGWAVNTKVFRRPNACLVRNYIAARHRLC